MNKIYEDLTIVTVLYDSSELINDLLKNLITFKVLVALIAIVIGIYLVKKSTSSKKILSQKNI